MIHSKHKEMDLDFIGTVALLVELFSTAEYSKLFEERKTAGKFLPARLSSFTQTMNDDRDDEIMTDSERLFVTVSVLYSLASSS